MRSSRSWKFLKNLVVELVETTRSLDKHLLRKGQVFLFNLATVQPLEFNISGKFFLLRGKAFPLGSARHSKRHYDRTTQFAGGLHHTPFFRAPPRTPLFPVTKLGKNLNGYNSDAFVGFIATSHHILRPSASFPLEFSDK